MAKKKKTEEITPELSPKEGLIKHLTESLSDDVVVIGIRNDGGFDILSTAQNYAMIQYLLSKGSFEMHLNHKAREMKAIEEAQ